MMGTEYDTQVVKMGEEEEEVVEVVRPSAMAT